MTAANHILLADDDVDAVGVFTEALIDADIAIHVARRLTSIDVLQTLADLFVLHGPPAHIRSDNGPEFTAKLIREWLRELDVMDPSPLQLWT